MVQQHCFHGAYKMVSCLFFGRTAARKEKKNRRGTILILSSNIPNYGVSTNDIGYLNTEYV